MKIPRLKLTASTPRSAFTLVELLVVIATLAVLASLAVGVMQSAQEDSRVAATRARVQTIEKLMEIELEDYEVRRSPIPFGNIGRIVEAVVAGGQWSNDPANRRLHAKNLKRMITLDLIRSEMPDFRVPTDIIGEFPSPRLLSYLRNDLNLTNAEIEPAFQGRKTANVFRWSNWEGGNLRTPTSIPDPTANSSEVLYRILSDLDVDGTSGIDLLGSRAVGDTDSDGFPEVIDAWGQPLRFQFHQRVIIPAEQNVAPPPSMPVNMRSGVWEPIDSSVFPNPPRLTDFNAILPNLPSEVSFFVTSDNLVEIEGSPNNFRVSNMIRHLEYQFN